LTKFFLLVGGLLFNLVPKQINRFFLQKGSVFPLEKICAARYIISVSKS